MTGLPDTAEKTERTNQEVRNYIDANLYNLQQARLDKRNNATLEDLFKSRNPYFLRSTGKVTFQLVRYCLDNYLLSVDEILFANFSHELSAFTVRRGQQLLEPSAILELFARDDLPMWIELSTAYDRAINRLTYLCYQELCDEQANMDWKRLARLVSESEARENVRDVVNAPK